MGVWERVARAGRHRAGLAHDRGDTATQRDTAPAGGAVGTGDGVDGRGAGDAPVRESAPPTREDYYWGRVATGSEEDYYWRRLSDNWYQKDVLPSTYLEIHNACYEAYNANPLANYIVEITTNFVLGNGLRVRAANRRVQRVIDLFWNDPDNHMDTRVYALCTEHSLYGEQFIRFFVNPYDGHVKIAQIDPSLIDEIETDPDNVERVLRVHRRAQGMPRDGRARASGWPAPARCCRSRSTRCPTQSGARAIWRHCCRGCAATRTG